MTRHYLDILADVIRDNWDQPALTDYSVLQGEGGNDYTYGQMYEKIQWLCDRFAQLGLHKGDHVAICGASCSNWEIGYLTVAAFEGVSVAILHSLNADQIESLINFSDSKCLLTDRNIYNKLNKQHIPQIKVILALDDFEILLGYDNGFINDNSAISRDDITFPIINSETVATICFTSGTTGMAKGVMLPMRAITNGVKNGVEILPICHRENYLSTLPFGHVFGMIDIISQLTCANHVYFVHDLAPIAMLEAMQKIKPYALLTVPEVIGYLYDKYGQHMQQLMGGYINEIVLGGSRLSSDLIQRMIADKFPFVLLYGATEGLIFSGSRINEYKLNSSGKVCSGMEASISREGEVLYRGKSIMLGYYKDEQATREKIDAEGWLHTGDRGHLDEEGYLYVEGRMNQDMIVLPSGENIHPENIESIINQIHGVQESLVLAREGKLIALVRMEQPISEDQYIAQRNALLAAVNPQLPAYAQLFGIEFISEPLSRTEKQTVKRYLYH